MDIATDKDMEAAAMGERGGEVERLCRLCATITTHPDRRVDIFAVDGLRNKIETCLPVHVFKESDLPDTLCMTCYDKINAFFAFRKRSLETLTILEAKYQTVQSCFIAKPPYNTLKYDKVDKMTLTERDTSQFNAFEQWKTKKLGDFQLDTQTQTKQQQGKQTMLNIALEIDKAEQLLLGKTVTKQLVDYNSSESEEETPVRENEGVLTNIKNKLYFDDKVNDIISEIVDRKRKLREDDAQPQRAAKSFKSDFESSSNRRKKSVPIKRPAPSASAPTPPPPAVQEQELTQVCLLCDQQFAKGSALARHVFDTHGIDMAQVLSSEPIPEVMQRSMQSLQLLQNLQQLELPLVHQPAPKTVKSPKSPNSPKTVEKKKKLPELVKITDLKTKRESIETKHVENDLPPTLTASFVCPLCPASLTNKTDLYAHLRVRHLTHAKLICGLCLHIATSLTCLQEHLDTCAKSHSLVGYFVCQVCKYSEDNQKSLENHVLVHDFLMSDCKKDGKIFDPGDFVDINELAEPKHFSCTECGQAFASFKDYSGHKRAEHSIFHCDLCNKSYGRNSHLWKHVNRVHKGHPSVTCQFCYKTSASKYHLLQHFNKIHTQKTGNPGNPGGASVAARKNGDVVALSNLNSLADSDEDFMTKKFEGFDFQSVRQSFMREELKKTTQTQDDVKVELPTRQSLNLPLKIPTPSVPPKELDSSSRIYTNIITNYTPPTNDGEFKCPKCSKAFHKRTLLKKHKKNCRPRLQKDLLTRCKSCSRIFKDRQSLAKHLVNYHSEYSCEMCAEKVQSKCEIVSHIRFTHPGSHLVCIECGNVLRNQDLLRAHLADHANSFVCQFCGDILPSKIKLKMHILSLHRKILSLSCGVCLKLFENQHILRDHVRLVHREALQPLTSCTVCGKNYGSKWKTYDHLNKSHGRVFRACKSCLEVFNNDTELQLHIDTMHSKGKKFVPSMAFKEEKILETTHEEIEAELDEEPDEEQEESAQESEQENNTMETKSILEKHLLVGNQQSYQQQQQKPQNVTNNNGNNGKQNGVGATSTPKKIALSADESLMNSSKRTVYVNSNDPSVCEICHKNWPAKKHLWQHYIRCHKQVAATVCGICLCTNRSYEALQKHLTREHPTLLHGKGFGSNFICRICGRYHNASSKLRLHMAIHIKFDWSLLERSGQEEGSQVEEPEVEDDEDEEQDDAEDQDADYVDIKQEQEVKEEAEEAINFESMIEQVECSTNTSSSSSESEEEEEQEAEDKAVEDEEGEVVYQVENDAEQEQEEEHEQSPELEIDDGDEDDEDDVEEEGESYIKDEPEVLEQCDEYEEEIIEEIVEDSQPEHQEHDVEMYEEELDESQVDYEEDEENDEDLEVQEISQEIIIKHITAEDDEEDEEDEPEAEEEPEVDEDDEEEIEEDTNSSAKSTSTSNEETMEVSYVQEAEIVDSAVKSICYDADSGEQVEEEYEVQSNHNLNQREIQNAVDSIL